MDGEIVALIGLLEQIKLSSLLGRIEAHTKTGLLSVQQGGMRVEFYFRDGLLMCIGPVRTATLGDRLLQDGVISPQALYEAKQLIDSSHATENTIALALLERGYVGHEQLRTWSMKKALDVLQALLTWATGEVHFEEGIQPPPDRLLVALSISSLLAMVPTPSQPGYVSASAQPGHGGYPSPAQTNPVPAPAQPAYLNYPAPVQSSPVPTPAQPARPHYPTPPQLNSVPTPARPGALNTMSEATASATLPAIGAASPHLRQESPTLPPITPAPDIAKIKTLMSASQIPSDGDSPLTPPSQPLIAREGGSGLFSAQSLLDNDAFTPRSLQARVPASQPLASQPLLHTDVLEPSPVSQPLVSDEPMLTVPSTTGSLSELFASTPEHSPLSPPSQQLSPSATFVPPQPITIPRQPRYVDTSYMRPDMILLPADLSALRERNVSIALTPDQWRLLTRVDGQTSLQTACQELAMRPEIVCQVAGELVAEHLIQLALPPAVNPNELSPTSRELLASGLGNGFVAPGYAAAPSQSWSASMPPAADVAPQPQFPSTLPFETQSQWGNGGNGATFIPGRGWVASPQPIQPLSPGGNALSYTGSYAGGPRQ